MYKTLKERFLYMLFFLILIFILVFILFLVFMFLLSTIKLEVKNLKVNETKINNDFNIKLSISLFDKINLLWINLNKERIEKLLNYSKKLKKINKNDFKKLKNKMPSSIDIIKEVLKLKINVIKFNLKMNLGLENAVITSYIVATISSIMGILISFASRKIIKCDYLINPIYSGRNIFNLELDSITSIKIVHIMYVIYILSKKGRVKNERTTSNRRSYDYSYGQY